MLDIDEYEVYYIINTLALIVGIIFGAIAQKNQFCFSGSIKDYFLTSSTKRAASVIMAMMSAIIFTQILSYIYDIDLSQSNYLKDNINYFSLIIGGTLFGSGMMIADGCSSRSLVKFAQGDVKAFITLLFIAIFALATQHGFLYEITTLIYTNETLLSLSSSVGNFKLNIYFALFFLSILLYVFTKKLHRVRYLYDGVIIGLLVASGWFITSVLAQDSIERIIPLESLSFIYPSAKTLELFSAYEVKELSFGVALLLGVIIGAFLMSKINKKYSFGCTSQSEKSNIKRNMLGGAMMGTGGIMALGCTVGQGLSGLSTLAFASFVVISSIFISGFFTAKYLHKKDALSLCFIFEWED